MVPCFRQTLKEIRQEVNTLSLENEKLKTQNTELEKNTKKLQEVEKQLSDLSVLQGQSVDELVKQVREYREISEKMEENVKSQIVQNIISVIFTADQDRDFIIDAEEVDGLKNRLTSIDGVDFSEENFNKALVKAGYDPSKIDIKKGGYSIQAVVEVLRNLMESDVPEEDNIFTIQKKI
jgi:DNA repair exonuclease SbcCD ATPase subunit